MCRPSLFFGLAGFAAFTSLAIALAHESTGVATSVKGGDVRPNEQCQIHSENFMPSPCGCPTTTLADFCSDVLPVDPNIPFTVAYVCLGLQDWTCTTNTRDCGTIYICYPTNPGDPQPRCDQGPAVAATCHPTQKYPPNCTTTRGGCENPQS